MSLDFKQFRNELESHFNSIKIYLYLKGKIGTTLKS